MGLRRSVMLHFAKTGASQQVATIPWISSDFTSLASPVGYGLRDSWYDNFGNRFVLKKGSGTINRGDVLTNQASVAQTLTGTSTTRIVNTTSSLTAGAEKGNFLIDKTLGESGSALTDVLKLIKDNSGAAGASTITVSLLSTSQSNQQADADAYSVAPANTDTAYLVRPDTVIVMPTGSTVRTARGIAVQNITTATWGFMQIGGYALCHVDGTTAAVVANNPVVASTATAGYVMGAATVQLTAKGNLIGEALQASTNNSGTTEALAVVDLCLEPYA